MNRTENTGDKKQKKREGNTDMVGSAMDRGRKPDFSPHLLRVKEQHWKAVDTSNEVGMDRVHVRQESKGGPEQSLGCLSPAIPHVPQSCLLPGLGHTEGNNQQKGLH